MKRTEIFFGYPPESIKQYIINNRKYYYDNIEDLLSDFYNDEIGKNTQNLKPSVSVTCLSDGKKIINFFNDVDEPITLSNLSNIELRFNSHKVNGNSTILNIENCNNITVNGCNSTVTSETQSNLINITNSSNIIFDNSSFNFTTVGSDDKNSPYSIFGIVNSTVSICSSQLEIQDLSQTKSVSVVNVDTSSVVNITTSNLHAISKNSFPYGIYSLGKLNIESSLIDANSNHTANADGTDYATTSRGIYSENDLSIINSSVYGTHSGITLKGGNTYIDGGDYYGYSHGGVYASKGITKIYNANLYDVPLNEGYVDDGVAGTNHAGLYIGNGENISVFVDNCNIIGEIQPIVVRNSSLENNNHLYISNSKTNLDCLEKYTPIIGNYGELSNIVAGIYGGGIRNYKTTNTIHFGENCGVADIKNMNDIQNDAYLNYLPIRPNYLRIESKTKTMNDYSFEVTNEKY